MHLRATGSHGRTLNRVLTLLCSCKDHNGGLIPSGKTTSDFPEDKSFPPVQSVNGKENNSRTLGGSQQGGAETPTGKCEAGREKEGRVK